jgi:hypothetical protein
VGWLCAVLLGGCAATGPVSGENVGDINFPEGMTKLAELPRPWTGNVAAGFVVLKPEESPANFTELAGEVTLRPAASMDEVINAAPPVGSAATTCPAANGKLELKPSTTSQRRGSYEYRVRGCAGVPDFVQIGEIITGKTTIWHFFYIIKGTEVPPGRAAEVTRNFAAIHFVQ